MRRSSEARRWPLLLPIVFRSLLPTHQARARCSIPDGAQGTAAGILARGIAEAHSARTRCGRLYVHFGPAICGACAEVGPEVYTQLTGREAHCPTYVDLRELLTDQARAAGIQHVSASRSCTRCNNDRFFSHRAGDEGRQLGVIIAR